LIEKAAGRSRGVTQGAIVDPARVTLLSAVFEFSRRHRDPVTGKGGESDAAGAGHDVRAVATTGDANRRDRTALQFSTGPQKLLAKRVSCAYRTEKAQLPACEAARDGDRWKTTVIAFASARKNNR
jgi:hypothetical protein